MRRSSWFVTGLLLLGLASCISPFSPDIDANDENKYVVNGQVILGDSLQTVNVSRTSILLQPRYDPVPGCQVIIVDDQGNAFYLADRGDGNYQGVIDSVYLVPGKTFRVRITVPEGDILQSDPDTLHSGGAITNAYYVREDRERNNAQQFLSGIQFYVDIAGGDTDSRYYRWDEIETWEYHTPYPLEWYYDGTVHQVIPPDYSRMVCWKTVKVPEIYTLSTRYLAQNRFAGFPIHYVTNRTDRLAIGYSVLIRQYALSEAAYLYWEQQKRNSQLEGGLYEKQPFAVAGNLHNITHPEKAILGFFGAASLDQKRLFVWPIPDLELNFNDYCSIDLLRFGFKSIRPSDYPAYLTGNHETWFPYIMSYECVNCLSLGGINVKPGFWPQ